MGFTNIRKMTLSDASEVISLNQTVVDVTSPIDSNRFAAHYELSTTKLVAELDGEVIGFVMAMTDGSPYDNGNYRWFSERLKNFMYIDRVVISDACRGLGIGHQLYSQTLDTALRSGVTSVCAEMDLEPPNRESLRFHEAAGFAQIGTRILYSGKRVSMQILSITSTSTDM